jgi:hypothetical protein
MNKDKIILDIGSSTIKVYKYTENKLNLVLQRSIFFKNGFDPEGGISEENKKELLDLLYAIKEENPGLKIETYATGIFRSFSPETKIKFIDEIFLKTGIFFNIISHNLENFYLEKALVGKCHLKEPLLLINIGGGTTELVIMYGEEAIERKNLEIGVSEILNKYSGINKTYSEIDLENLVKELKEKLPIINNKAKIAFLTGGELTYMKLAKYPLRENNLFADEDHPYFIYLKDYQNKNKEVFQKISLEELENLMPENPRWMHGARPFSALAQAVCEKYEIEIIIPSDSNLINGVIRQPFRYATISGSFRKHLDYILKIIEGLIQKGVHILSPRFTEDKNPGEEFVIFSDKEGLTPLELERYHLNSISNSDVLIVCDPEGYVDNSALLEIGYAHSLGKRIIFTEKPQELIFNQLPHEVGL